MNTSSEGTAGAFPKTMSQEGLTVSSRKLAANRRNARRSTGPRTRRGKLFSCLNALKHGLFARLLTSFEAQNEDPTEYEQLWDGLRKQYQPVGHAEELEVERLAQSWWRLKRAHRYENAVNAVAQRDIRKREMAEQREYCKNLEEGETAAIQLLKSAEAEIEASGEIPQELKDKVSAVMAGSEVLWPGFTSIANEMLKEAIRRGIEPKPSPKMRGTILAQLTVGLVVRELERLAEPRASNVWETAVAQHVIPNRDALDKLLRYETSIDRYLSRSLDRLERMQRQRRGEDELSHPR